jgi:hypothetical protein
MVHFAILTTLGEIAAASAVEALVVPSTVTVHLLARGEVIQDGERVAKVIVQFALRGD